MKPRVKYIFWNYRLVVMQQAPNWKIHLLLVAADRTVSQK